MNCAQLMLPVEILLVEDNPGDARLILEALKDTRLKSRLHVVEDGVMALDFLRLNKPFQDAPRPDLILLDLNLPKKSGREVLAAIRADKQFNTIPVVIFTTSRADEDIACAYALNANCYITKPVGFSEFITMVQAIENLWVATAILPPKYSTQCNER